MPYFKRKNSREGKVASDYLEFPLQPAVLMSELEDGEEGHKVCPYTDPLLVVPGEPVTPPIRDDMGNGRVYQAFHSQDEYLVVPPMGFYFNYLLFPPPDDNWGNMLGWVDGFSTDANQFDPKVHPFLWSLFFGDLSYVLDYPYTYTKDTPVKSALDPLKPAFEEVCAIPQWGNFGGGTVEAREDYSGEEIIGCYLRALHRKYLWLWQYEPEIGSPAIPCWMSLLAYRGAFGIELAGEEKEVV
jgi:hypothetical protein